MWILWIIIAILTIILTKQIIFNRRIAGLCNLFRAQNYSYQGDNPEIDEVNIGYIYGLARSLTTNVTKSKRIFFTLATLIYGRARVNQAMMALMAFSTQEETDKEMFVAAANAALQDVSSMSALVSNYDPLSATPTAKMPNGLSQLYAKQRKKK